MDIFHLELMLVNLALTVNMVTVLSCRKEIYIEIKCKRKVLRVIFLVLNIVCHVV